MFPFDPPEKKREHWKEKGCISGIAKWHEEKLNF